MYLHFLITLLLFLYSDFSRLVLLETALDDERRKNHANNDAQAQPNKFPLAFDRAYHDALNEVPLNERVYAQERKHDDHDGGAAEAQGGDQKIVP